MWNRRLDRKGRGGLVKSIIFLFFSSSYPLNKHVERTLLQLALLALSLITLPSPSSKLPHPSHPPLLHWTLKFPWSLLGIRLTPVLIFEEYFSLYIKLFKGESLRLFKSTPPPPPQPLGNSLSSWIQHLTSKYGNQVFIRYLYTYAAQLHITLSIRV